MALRTHPYGCERNVISTRMKPPIRVGFLFGTEWDSKDQIQAAGGSLVGAGWTAPIPLFSLLEKMQTNH